jgi:hypothetical protein
VQEMPWKHPERIRARKSVTQRFRKFVSFMMKQFATPPDELLNRAEARLQSHAAGDKPAEPAVPDPIKAARSRILR